MAEDVNKDTKQNNVVYHPTEKRNEVTITHANASVTIKSEEPLTKVIQSAENIIKKVKTKVAGCDEYGS